MVRLTVTSASYAAIQEYCRVITESTDDEANSLEEEKLSQLQIGSPIEHEDLIEISKCLVDRCRQQENRDEVATQWRLEILLKGANVYQPPPPPKPEPVCCSRNRIEV